ncbi:ABC transporter permease [Sphingobacterium mizutaii]|uniref:ABC transporter permease n=1 Tax=Sphingobacterium mizutaii TaxID=1010 RepID=UPI00162AA50B|nr:ABC transporter permease [Sphingobacterium mizutaii]
MNWSYIKIAWRNISKKKLQNIINLIGLICGITFIMIVGAYIWDAKQVNAHLKNKDQQYLLQSSYKKEGLGLDITTVGALPKALAEEYPQLVKNYYRLDGLTCIVSNGTDKFEEGASLGDPSLLAMFGFELHAGDINTALKDPFSLVITEAAAMKYFGRTDALGEQLSIRNFNGEKHDFMITGIIKPSYQNSVLELTPALRSDFFLPIASEKYFGRDIDNWENPYIIGFLELQQNVSPGQLTTAIKTLVSKHTDKTFADNYSPDLKPLKSYYLESNDGAIQKMIDILLYIAGFILLMAIINFINFNLGQNIGRLKEIGIRKIMGAQSNQIASLLLTEYVILLCLILLICLPLYILAKPLFENIFMRRLPQLTELPYYFFLGILLFSILIGLISGLYPAIKLSRNSLLNSVKLQFDKVKNKHSIRKALLFLQFTTAIVILTSTIIIARQIHLFVNSDLGYNKEYILTVQTTRDWSPEGVRKTQTIQQELEKLNEIEDISLSYETPNNIVGKAEIALMDKSDEPINSQMIISDSKFADTYQIPMLAGQFFSSNLVDSMAPQEVVINRKAMNVLGYEHADDIIGRNLRINGSNDPIKVVGITENFIPNSMHNPNTAIIWLNVAQNNFYRYFNIRMKPGSISNSIQNIEKNWHFLMPDAPFEYHFMEENIRKMYETELQLYRASISATVITLIIVCLGIIGLVSLSISARSKEVGMRKILGAKLSDLLVLFSKEYYLLFIASVLTAVPISFFMMKKWLTNYEFRIQISAWNYLLPILLLLALLAGLILFILYRNGRGNPIHRLKED